MMSFYLSNLDGRAFSVKWLKQIGFQLTIATWAQKQIVRTADRNEAKSELFQILACYILLRRLQP